MICKKKFEGVWESEMGFAVKMDENDTKYFHGKE